MHVGTWEPLRQWQQADNVYLRLGESHCLLDWHTIY